MPKTFLPFLGKTGFDNEKYVHAQSSAIISRASKFEKLYLEFGGKLLYDYHAARVLPGYELDAKMQVIRELAKKKPVEFLLCASARDLQAGKKVGSLGISYRDFSLKLIDSIRESGFPLSTIVVNFFSGEQKAREFGSFLRKKGCSVYYRGLINKYPKNLKAIASARGFGKRPFIKTKKPIVIVTGAGPGSGKLATCLAMVFQDHLQGKDSGYAKFETFPIWNLPISSPINAAYEAATADLGDYNQIDQFHLKAHKTKAVNYNRDVQAFPIIQKIIKEIASPSNFMRTYKSPTDMGINRAADAIIRPGLCEKAARQEIIRRYFSYSCDVVSGSGKEESVSRVEKIMKKYKIQFSERPVVKRAREAAGKAFGGMSVGCALMLPSGEILVGSNSSRMHAEPAAIMNALKRMAGISSETDVLLPEAIEQIRKLKRKIHSDESENLDISEILIVLAISAKYGAAAASAFSEIENLRSCELHTTHMLSKEDSASLRALGINSTSDGNIGLGRLYYG